MSLVLIFTASVSLSSSSPAKRSEVLPAASLVTIRPTGDSYSMHHPRCFRGWHGSVVEFAGADPENAAGCSAVPDQ